MTGGSALVLESEAKLPVELAIERHKRAAQLKQNAAARPDELPQVRLPYRMWRAPALDFVVSGGVTYRAPTGTKVDRRAVALCRRRDRASVLRRAVSTNDDRACRNTLRLRAYRSDPDGGLLGPLERHPFRRSATSPASTAQLLGAGDQRPRRRCHQPAACSRPASFDRTRFEGDLPSGWEAELYRNGELLGFRRSRATTSAIISTTSSFSTATTRSTSSSTARRARSGRAARASTSARTTFPPGKTWYWAGVNQPGRDLVDFSIRHDDPNRPKAQATVVVEHGLDERTSVGAARPGDAELEDERLTYVEGTVRRSIGPALVEVAAARDDKGGTAARAQVLAKIGDGQPQRRGDRRQQFSLARAWSGSRSARPACRSTRRSSSAAPSSRPMPTCAIPTAATARS